MNNIVDRIPDVWFDIYGRFLPGLYALLLLGYFYFPPGRDPEFLLKLSVVNLVCLLLVGFLLGHILQPVASLLTKGIGQINSKITDDQHTRYSAIKVQFNHALTRTMLLEQKNYSEAVGFSAIAIANVLVAASLGLKQSCDCPVCIVLLVLALVSMFLAWDRTQIEGKNILRILENPPTPPQT